MATIYTINELELSINNKCNLQCAECGFLIPNQPYPTISSDIIQEHCECLNILHDREIYVNSLAILGGEPTLNSTYLEQAVIAISKFDNIHQIEIVTNGLNPKGFTEKTLESIQKISVSVYDNDDEFITAWKKFIERKHPWIKLEFRIQKQWDINSGNHTVSGEQAKKMFDDCWYKKHCVTIERQRLFVCSIAPKHANDCDGLLLQKDITQNQIIAYLMRNAPLDYCKNCIPQMKLGKVKAGIQGCKIDLQKLMNNAKRIINTID